MFISYCCFLVKKVEKEGKFFFIKEQYSVLFYKPPLLYKKRQKKKKEKRHQTRAVHLQGVAFTKVNATPCKCNAF